jgi:hypothetical protein
LDASDGVISAQLIEECDHGAVRGGRCENMDPALRKLFEK